MPSYDPRGTFGMGLGYATSDRGGCHMRAFTAGDDILGGSGRRTPSRQGPTRRRPAGLQRPGLDRRLVRQHGRGHRLHRRPLPPPLGSARYEEELITTGARIWNLGRLLNLREGLAGRPTTPCRSVSSTGPTPTAAPPGQKIGPDAFAAALDEYYAAARLGRRRRAAARRRWSGSAWTCAWSRRAEADGPVTSGAGRRGRGPSRRSSAGRHGSTRGGFGAHARRRRPCSPS